MSIHNDSDETAAMLLRDAIFRLNQALAHAETLGLRVEIALGTPNQLKGSSTGTLPSAFWPAFMSVGMRAEVRYITRTEVTEL